MPAVADIGGTFIMERWCRTFLVAPGEADQLQDHETQLALFSLRHGFSNHQRAVACLKLLVEGLTAREAAIFVDSGPVPGIHLRKRALGSMLEDIDNAELAEYHGSLFPAERGPEVSDEPYIFMNACPLHSVRSEVSGAKLIATFTAVTSYPAEAYREALPFAPQQLATHRVLFPRALNAIDWCVHELWHITRDVLGDDADLVEFEWDIREIPYEELSP